MMKIPGTLFMLMLYTLFSACAVQRTPYQPKKFSQAALQEDYQLFRKILEEAHPGLYWFNEVDSMNYYFDAGYAGIRDSMDEAAFRRLLTAVANRIRCGHTSIRYSHGYSQYLDTLKRKVFPLSLNFWADSAVVRGNLLAESPVKKGFRILEIDGRKIAELRDTLFQYITVDGYSIGGKYRGLSNSGNFGGWYRNHFGLNDPVQISYLDLSGNIQTVIHLLYDPARDSSLIERRDSVDRRSRKDRKANARMLTRNLQVDSSMGTAFMSLRSFARGNGLPVFFRKSFRYLDKSGLNSLIIDLRSNGGGDAGNSVMLLRYLRNSPFKIADSLYAVSKSSRYRSHISQHRLYWLMMTVVTRKRKDGLYHFGYFERKIFKPKKKHHFGGNIYLLTGGNTFSAASMFAQKLKGQDNVIIVGEETGGGAYGNNAWMIPDVHLPNSGMRFRLPKFRLVMEPELVAEGRGVMPDLHVPVNGENTARGIDAVAVVRRLIELNDSYRDN